MINYAIIDKPSGTILLSDMSIREEAREALQLFKSFGFKAAIQKSVYELKAVSNVR